MTLLLALVLQASTPTVDDVWNAEPFANADAWESVDSGPLKVDRRKIKGTSYFEFRVVTEAEGTVDAFCVAVFEWGTKESDSPGLKESKVLVDGADARVVYNRIEQPVVSSRDYAMTVVRKHEGPRCGIRFKATNELAPKAPDGVVRMDRLWGSWAFEPVDGGKVKVTYTLFSDPAGSVPPFLVHGPQKSASVESVKKAISRAKARASAPAGAAAQ